MTSSQCQISPRFNLSALSPVRTRLSRQAPFPLFSFQLAEKPRETPPPNFADYFPPPAHTQTMSTNSKHGNCARWSKPARRISSRSFQGPRSPRVQLKTIHSAGSAVAKIIKAVIFRLKSTKIAVTHLPPTNRSKILVDFSRFFPIFVRETPHYHPKIHPNQDPHFGFVRDHGFVLSHLRHKEGEEWVPVFRAQFQEPIKVCAIPGPRMRGTGGPHSFVAG